MKFTTSLLIAALAFAPTLVLAKTKAAEPAATSKTTLTTGSVQNPLNINSASDAELLALFGKKESKAKAKNDVTAVIGGRPYASTDELKTKKIISTKLYGEIKSKISAQ